MHIAILGAGSYGRALAEILKANHHSIQFFDPYKFPTVTLYQILPRTDVIILATPADIAPKLLKFIPTEYHHLPIICATKGLLDFDLIRQFPRFSIFAGPAFASTLRAATRDPFPPSKAFDYPTPTSTPIPITITSALAGHLFRHPRLTFQNTADETGVLLCSALKNLYAVHSGLKNYAARPTSRAFNRFILAAHQETKLVLKHHHCSPATATLACGLDDLILTSASSESRNYRFGVYLASKPSLHKSFPSPLPPDLSGATIESLTIARRYHHLFNVKNTPLLRGIIELISSLQIDPISPL